MSGEWVFTIAVMYIFIAIIVLINLSILSSLGNIFLGIIGMVLRIKPEDNEKDDISILLASIFWPITFIVIFITDLIIPDIKKLINKIKK